MFCPGCGTDLAEPGLRWKSGKPCHRCGGSILSEGAQDADGRHGSHIFYSPPDDESELDKAVACPGDVLVLRDFRKVHLVLFLPRIFMLDGPSMRPAHMAASEFNQQVDQVSCARASTAEEAAVMIRKLNGTEEDEGEDE